MLPRKASFQVLCGPMIVFSGTVIELPGKGVYWLFEQFMEEY